MKKGKMSVLTGFDSHRRCEAVCLKMSGDVPKYTKSEDTIDLTLAVTFLQSKPHGRVIFAKFLFLFLHWTKEYTILITA